MLDEMREQARAVSDPTDRANLLDAIDEWERKWRPLWRHPSNVDPNATDGDEQSVRPGHRISYQNKFTTFDTRDPHTTGVMLFALLWMLGGRAEINWPEMAVRYNKNYMMTDIKGDTVRVELMGKRPDIVLAT